MFKAGKVCYGVRIPIVRNIAKKYFKEIRDKDKKNIFALCKKLLSSGFHEPLVIASSWAYNVREQHNKDDFELFESWFKKHVHNWAACDDFCAGFFGYLILQYPNLLSRVFKWTKSKNRWLHRASAVILIYSIRKGKYLQYSFKTSDALLLDQDDLVQKGYGWMLKETSNLYPREVFVYVMKHRRRMPRTDLRYAIEKLPQKMKNRAMKRE